MVNKYMYIKMQVDFIIRIEVSDIAPVSLDFLLILRKM